MTETDEKKPSIRDEYPDWGYILLAFLFIALLVGMGAVLIAAWHFNLLPRQAP